MPETHDRLVASFGRRHGRKLKPSRSSLIETLLPKLRITLPEGALDVAALFPRAPAPLWFEIGFGNGEHMVEQARRNRDINFIGCEPYVNGMARLLVEIDKDKLTNIRLYDGDARMLLEKIAGDSIERLFILFPDPWPKVRHHKRRLISQETLQLFYNKLKPGGLLRIATDHVDYCTWILEQLLSFKKLVWQVKSQADWQTPPKDWVETRYQSKAAAEGRPATFLDLKKPISPAVTIA